MIAFTIAPFHAYGHALSKPFHRERTAIITFLVVAVLAALICVLTMEPDLESFRASVQDLFEEFPEASWYFSALAFTLFYFGLCYISSLYLDSPKQRPSPKHPSFVPRSATDPVPPNTAAPPQQPACVPPFTPPLLPLQVNSCTIKGESFTKKMTDPL